MEHLSPLAFFLKKNDNTNYLLVGKDKKSIFTVKLQPRKEMIGIAAAR
jgi:hypothetical protein